MKCNRIQQTAHFTWYLTDFLLFLLLFHIVTKIPLKKFLFTDCKLCMCTHARKHTLIFIRRIEILYLRTSPSEQMLNSTVSSQFLVSHRSRHNQTRSANLNQAEKNTSMRLQFQFWFFFSFHHILYLMIELRHTVQENRICCKTCNAIFVVKDLIVTV